MILTTSLITLASWAIYASASAIPRDPTDAVELAARSDPVITFNEYLAYQCYPLPISWSGGTPGAGFYLELGAWDLTPGAEYPFVTAQTFYPVFFKNLVWNIPYLPGTKIGVILNQGDWTNGWTPTIRNATVLGPAVSSCALSPTQNTGPSRTQSSSQSPGQNPSHTSSVSPTTSAPHTTAHSTSAALPSTTNTTKIQPSSTLGTTAKPSTTKAQPSPTVRTTAKPSPTSTGGVDPYPNLTWSLQQFPPHQCGKVVFSWTYTGPVYLNFWAIDTTPGVTNPWVSAASPYFPGNVTTFTWDVPWGAGTRICVDIWFGESSTAVPWKTLKVIAQNATVLDPAGSSCATSPTHFVSPSPSPTSSKYRPSTTSPSPTSIATPSGTTPHPEPTLSMNPWPPHQCKPVHMSWTFTGTGPIYVEIWAFDATPGIVNPWVIDPNEPLAANVTNWTWNVPWGAGALVRVKFFFGDNSDGTWDNSKTIERNATILDSPGISCSISPTHNSYVVPPSSTLDSGSVSQSTSKSPSASKLQSTAKPSKTTVPQSSPPRSTSMPHSTSNTPTTSTKAPIYTSSPPPTPTTSSFDSHSEISPYPYPVPTAPNSYLEWKGSFNRCEWNDIGWQAPQKGNFETGFTLVIMLADGTRIVNLDNYDWSSGGSIGGGIYPLLLDTTSPFIAVALYDIWGNYQFLNARPITGNDTSCIKKK